MKYTIRSSTFETNSSSAHTFIKIKKDTYTKDLELQEYLEEDGSVYIAKNGKKYLFISSDEFGREFRFLNTWLEKARYIIASCKDDQEKINNVVIPAILSRFKGFDGVCFNFFEESLLDCYEYEFDSDIRIGRDVYINDYWNTVFDYGSVDHQSYNNLDLIVSALKSSSKEISEMSDYEIYKEIIYNNNYVIVVDSDDEDALIDYIKSGMFKTKDVLALDYDFDNNYKEINCRLVPIDERYLKFGKCSDD